MQQKCSHMCNQRNMANCGIIYKFKKKNIEMKVIFYLNLGKPCWVLSANWNRRAPLVLSNDI